MDKFSLAAIYRSYNVKDFAIDSIVPFCISLFISTFLYLYDKSNIEILSELINITLTVLPGILSFLIAGYAIIMTLFWSDLGKEIRRLPSGEKTLNEINSSFAALLIIMIFTIISFIIAKFMILIDVKSHYANEINSLFFLVLLYLLLYTIYTLKDIIYNIFNLGKFTIQLNKLKDEKAQNDRQN